MPTSTTVSCTNAWKFATLKTSRSSTAAVLRKKRTSKIIWKSRTVVDHRLKGDMSALLEHIPLSREEDLPRFFKYFESNMGTGGKFAKFAKKYKATKNNVRRVENEMTHEERDQALSSLADQIRNKNKQRNDAMAIMFAKYGGDAEPPKSLTQGRERSRNNKKPVKMVPEAEESDGFEDCSDDGHPISKGKTLKGPAKPKAPLKKSASKK